MSKKTTPEKKNRKLLVQMVITSTFSTCLMNIEYNCENVLRSFETLSGTMGCSSALVRFWIAQVAFYLESMSFSRQLGTRGVDNIQMIYEDEATGEHLKIFDSIDPEINYHPGDALFVFTDGILKAVTDAVHDFVGDAPQFDDMTMLALIYDGKEAVL